MMTLEELENEEENLKDKYLAFLLEGERFAVSIAYVKEIISIQAITSVPYVPSEIKGLINLRGKIITVMDMRLRLGKKETTYDDRTCIIIIEVGEKELGLIVDQVQEVICMSETQQMQLIEESNKLHLIQQVAKSNDTIVQLIDCNKLLASKEIDD